MIGTEIFKISKKPSLNWNNNSLKSKKKKEKRKIEIEGSF
jgi:hypothetical protein